MLYPQFHHIGFKIISTYFMFITIKQNNQKIEDLQKIRVALENKNQRCLGLHCLELRFSSLIILCPFPLTITAVIL